MDRYATTALLQFGFVALLLALRSTPQPAPRNYPTSGAPDVATVDQVGGDSALLEYRGRLLDWPLAELPAGTVEGSRVASTWPLRAEVARLDRLETCLAKSTTPDTATHCNDHWRKP